MVAFTLLGACSPPSSTVGDETAVHLRAEEPDPTERNKGGPEEQESHEPAPFSPLTPADGRNETIQHTEGRPAPGLPSEGLESRAVPSLDGKWSASGQVRTPEGVFPAPPEFEGLDYWAREEDIRRIRLYGFHRESDVERERYGMGLMLQTRDLDGLELDSIWLGLPRPGLIENYGLLLDRPADWLNLDVGQSLRRTATSGGDPYIVTLLRPSPRSVQLTIEPGSEFDGNLVVSINYGSSGLPWDTVDVEIFGDFQGQRISGRISLTRAGQ